MPRRLHSNTPRLSSSGAMDEQGSSKAGPSQAKFTTVSIRKRMRQDADSGSSSEDTSAGDSEEPDLAEADVSPDEEQDIDAPRVAQWVDEDDLDSEDEQEDSEVGKMDIEEVVRQTDDLNSLQNDLASLPLGALRKAQRALARTQVESESEDGTDAESELDHHKSETEPEVKRADKPEWSAKPRTDISKRKNKHAPMEVTSKKPVTRRRQIVDVPKVGTRDPRFLPFVGQFKPESFRKHYDFLSDMHTTEMKTLREHLRRAKKLLVSSPRELREEREQEVARLELAVKRSESYVNKDKREKIEQEALDNVKKEERSKRKTGKGAWYMKDSDKRKVLVRARYEALAAEGGKIAVKKAMEKKQKKDGQKEKKKRPSGGQVSRKRQRVL